MKEIKGLKAELLRENNIDGVPSASAMEKSSNGFYLVGDDAPWLFLLNEKMQVVDKIRISTDAETVDGRIIKKEKKDYEAMTVVPMNGKEQLLIFGSGSFAEKRDFMYRWPVEGEGKEYNLNSFYNYLRQLLGERQVAMNIEAAAYWNQRLLLLNRDGNILFSFSLDALMKYLEHGGSLPEPLIFQYDLPEIEGIQAGFSGAYVQEDSDLMLFTATIEDTKDWYLDGRILGSFVGVVDLGQPKNPKPLCVQVMDKKAPYRGKIESLVLKEQKNNQLYLVAVSDNDDGTSSFVEIKVDLEME